MSLCDENHTLRNQVQDLLLQVATLKAERAALLRRVEDLSEDLEALEPIVRDAAPVLWQITYGPVLATPP